MRVAHVCLGGPKTTLVDGIRSSVEQLARVQREAGDEVLVLADAGDGGRFGGVTGTARSLREFGPDLVHFHSVFRPVHCVLAAGLARRGVPYVVSPHSGLAPLGLARQRRRKQAWIGLFERPFLRGARAVLCLTPMEGADVRAVEPRARTQVVNNIRPREDAPQWRPQDGGAPTFLTLARFDVWQKGLDVLSDLARLVPGARFVVHGAFDSNDPRGAAALIEAAPPNLEFREPVRGEEKRAALAGCDYYIQTSRWEGMSMSVLEAMGAGIPCIVSPYIAGTLEEGRRYVVELADSPERSARIVEAVLADPEDLRRRAREGAAWVQDRYASGAVLQQLRRAYAHSA